MKIILTILFTIASTMATALPVDVVNAYRVGGSFFRSGVSLNEHNPSAFNEVMSVGSCAEAITILKNTDKPTIAIWDYVSHEIASNSACKVEDDMFITTYVSAYHSICSLKDEHDLQYLLNNPAKVGVADWHTVKTASASILEGINSPSKTVVYSTSKDYELALEIGEIEYIYTNRPSDKMNCVLSNDPESDVKHTGELFDHPFASSGNNIAVIGVNVNKDEIQELLLEASTNSNWSKNFTYYKNNFSKLSREVQLATYKGLVALFQ